MRMKFRSFGPITFEGNAMLPLPLLHALCPCGFKATISVHAPGKQDPSRYEALDVVYDTEVLEMAVMFICTSFVPTLAMMLVQTSMHPLSISSYTMPRLSYQ